ncbi:MAG TPA: hypothetical protein VFF11_15400, partial [Candidatus Binatia bacterium]|nr:hypothetical protein [Candidatus Binatia bacterium]
REGVFIPRRDTSSALQAFAGSRVFPGVHHAARFEVREEADEFQLQMRSSDSGVSVGVHARRTSKFSTTSVFTSLTEASEFFARGSVGYSATENPNCCDGLELYTPQWQVVPLKIQSVTSSFFDDTSRFPNGTIFFDCALLMQNIEHEWRVQPRMERSS